MIYKQGALDKRLKPLDNVSNMLKSVGKGHNAIIMECHRNPTLIMICNIFKCFCFPGVI